MPIAIAEARRLRERLMRGQEPVRGPRAEGAICSAVCSNAELLQNLKQLSQTESGAQVGKTGALATFSRSKRVRLIFGYGHSAQAALMTNEPGHKM
jgi:hypothetical protein